MVLLHVAHHWRSADASLRFVVVHVHHGVRGADADADAELVVKTCAQLEFPFRLLKIDPAQWCGPGGFESRARTARYTLLQQVRAEFSLPWIFTAHHRDDQAETVCLRLMRGTTLLGLRGVRKQREDGVLRPLLPWGRIDLCAYAETHSISWREDRSNQDTRFTRNLVRHGVLPALRKEWAGSDEALARLATSTEELWPKLVGRLENIFGSCRSKAPIWMSYAGLERAPVVLWLDWNTLQPLLCHWELFRLWMAEQGITWENDSEANRLRLSMQSGMFTRMTLGSWRVERADGLLAWVDGRNWFPGPDNMYLFHVVRRDPGGSCSMPPVAFSAAVDASQVPEGIPLVLRGRRDGDLYSPPGLRSKRRKLKQWLQESGIHPCFRDKLLLVACGNEVVWIPGAGVSGLYRTDTGSTHVLELGLEWTKNL